MHIHCQSLCSILQISDELGVVFSLNDAEMDRMATFVKSYFHTHSLRGAHLEGELARVLQHWEDHFPHLFLTLTDFCKCEEDVAYVRRKKLEVSIFRMLTLNYTEHHHRKSRHISFIQDFLQVVKFPVILWNRVIRPWGNLQISSTNWLLVVPLMTPVTLNPTWPR